MEEYRKETRVNDEEKEEAFLRERLERWGHPQQDRVPPFDPFKARKSKFVACLLSFLIPGTGQLYLGLMQRGMGLMLLLILDIFAIVFFATNSSSNIPLIVLFSLFVPVIYFYNIFDALQQTDRVNGRWHDGLSDPLDSLGRGQSFPGVPKRFKGSTFGYVLIIGGIFLFLVSNKPAWLNQVFEWIGSSIGAIILIVIGVALFLKESFKK
ncbi:hypothetical protein [Paenibacillus rigui]|uniref:Uncharacterized protein n=1 Tax=Paenibacillus rigui TaxID=554312 RepID=A0A229UKF7_9BACL|nr:hypothetical protein [Paenibacillus rigui]OXM83937.1 hypothetical protein CF651_22760 [Paenibacillus rigui]